MSHKTWTTGLLAAVLIATSSLAGCGDGSREERAERYTSPTVQGAAQRINLEAVEKAFWSSKGNDLNTWMGNFEQRVNEIYDGNEIVALDATRQKDLLKVTGYIENNDKPGFNGDDKLFAIEQTGPAANSNVPVRMTGSGDAVYYEGPRVVDNSGSSFLTGMLMGAMIGNALSGGYHTPHSRYNTLSNSRSKYRSTSAYKVQRDANKSFGSRFKPQGATGTTSSRSFNSTTKTNANTSTNKSRSWNNSRPAAKSNSGSSGSSWGSRRSSGSSGSSRRSFGGRRR